MARFDVLVETDAQKSKAVVSKLSFCSTLNKFLTIFCTFETISGCPPIPDWHSCRGVFCFVCPDY